MRGCPYWYGVWFKKIQGPNPSVEIGVLEIIQLCCCFSIEPWQNQHGAWGTPDFGKYQKQQWWKIGPCLKQDKWLKASFEIHWVVSLPIGSMVLLYIVTWIPSIYPSHVSIFISTMDPMGYTAGWWPWMYQWITWQVMVFHCLVASVRCGRIP